jgi:hypothetical protein
MRLFALFFLIAINNLWSNDQISKNTDQYLPAAEKPFELNGTIFYKTDFIFFNYRLNSQFDFLFEPIVRGKDQLLFAQIEFESFSDIIHPNESNRTLQNLIVINDAYKTLFYNKELIIFTFHQIYIDYHFDIFDLRIGRQIISWGASDSPYIFYNPNAVLTSYKQYETIITPLKNSLIGKDSIKITFGGNIHQFEIVYIPVLVPLKQVDYDNFWSSNMPAYKTDGYIDNPNSSSSPSLHYVLNSITFDYDNNLQDIFKQTFATRYKLNIGSFEAAIQYYYGISNIPYFQTFHKFSGNGVNCMVISEHCNGDLSDNIKLKAVFPRFHNIGLSILNNFQTISVHADFNYERGETPYEKENLSEINNISGLPNNLDIIIETNNKLHPIDKFSTNIGLKYAPFNIDDLSINLDVFLKYQDIDTKLTDIPIYILLLIPSIDWHIIQDKWNLSYILFWDTLKKDFLHSMTTDFYPSEKIKMSLGILLIHGKSESQYSGIDFAISSFLNHNMAYLRFAYLF